MEEPVASDQSTDLVDQLQQILSDGSASVRRQEAVRLLQQLLTPAVCRRLGLYPVPEDFLLSVIVLGPWPG